jgi:hypothetical protein
MKDYESFILEVKELCHKHGIGMVGTCEGEGIYGEITLFDLAAPEKCGWLKVLDHMWNFEIR